MFELLTYNSAVVETIKKRNPIFISQPRCQKEGVVEEGKIGHSSGIFALFTCVVADANTASPPDAVPAAGPLCTHGKDKPGLGAPNSLKLLLLLLLPVVVITTLYIQRPLQVFKSI